VFVRDLKKGILLRIGAQVILSVLTIQFTPIEYRLQILRDVYEHLADDGVFIFVEKVLGETACLDRLFRNNYYAMKEANGYTEEEIERKKLSLEGVLVPVTASMNEQLLKASGFKEVDCFWRWSNFAGWVALK
jgi:tRNA (cmo5U34)-methyltransferase